MVEIMDIFKELKLSCPTINTLLIQMAGHLERFVVMMESVSQAVVMTTYARIYLDHVKHAMKTVTVCRVVATFLSALAWTYWSTMGVIVCLIMIVRQGGAKDTLTGNVKQSWVMAILAVKTQTVFQTTVSSVGQGGLLGGSALNRTAYLLFLCIKRTCLKSAYATILVMTTF
mmetsp:Transcript_4662/g.6383  ORF Transcript_4662/g.6383 Transcript_4662/m.6383 type:complete len:172 (-) Transcript_4662:45-560(-)